jgi:hypothetical protein
MADMFRRGHRHFKLEASRAKDGGYIVRLLRKGVIVHNLGGDEKGQGIFQVPIVLSRPVLRGLTRIFLRPGRDIKTVCRDYAKLS